MSSDVLVLGAMLVTIASTIWWALTPERIDMPDRLWVTEDVYEAEAA